MSGLSKDEAHYLAFMAKIALQLDAWADSDPKPGHFDFVNEAEEIRDFVRAERGRKQKPPSTPRLNA